MTSGSIGDAKRRASRRRQVARLLVVLVSAAALAVEGLPAPPPSARGLGLQFPSGFLASAVDWLTGPDDAHAQRAEPDPAVAPVLYQAPQGRSVDPDSVPGLVRRETSTVGPRGRPVVASEEVESLTTESQRVVQNPDGSFTAEISSGPSRFRDEGGDWREIDLTVEEQADGSLEPEQSPVDVVVAPESTDELVEVTTRRATHWCSAFPTPPRVSRRRSSRSRSLTTRCCSPTCWTAASTSKWRRPR